MNMKEILDNFIMGRESENFNNKKAKKSEMSERERFERIYSHKVNKDVYEYLESHFYDLKIEILGDHEGNIMDLMKNGLLEGWCWQTTETAILFLEDDSYIERGNLKFDTSHLYYHSWITFNYMGQEYVFDPCLQILCAKDIYSKIFETDIKGKVTARQVKEYFINYITNPPKKNYSKETENFMKSFFGEAALERTKGEVVVHDEENPNAPMYRNGVGYKATIENGMVKKLVAHYYVNA